MNLDKENFKTDYKKKLMSLFAEDINDASPLHKYFALGSLIKEYCSDKWMKTNKQYTENNEKQIYYFLWNFS